MKTYKGAPTNRDKLGSFNNRGQKKARKRLNKNEHLSKGFNDPKKLVKIIKGQFHRKDAIWGFDNLNA